MDKHSRKLTTSVVLTALMTGAIFGHAGQASADVTNSLIMSQYNAVSGSNYLSGTKSDPQLGRIQGNGQNWLEFLTTKTDPGKNTLDLRGYEIDWSYSKDAQNFGSGTMTFSQDSVWQSVPLGTAVTINEWQQAWYLVNTPDQFSGNPNGDPQIGGGGMQRDGGIDGLGQLKGTAYVGSLPPTDPNAEKLLDFSTNTAWNPNTTIPSGQIIPAGPDWNINVWAGQQSGGNFQYFSFSGSVTKSGVASAIGTEAGGLFVSNNDNWQFTIKDSHGNVVQGPIGEALKASGGWGGSGLGSDELGKVQSATLQVGAHPTLANWQGITGASYADGSTSNFAGPSQWTDVTTQTADLSPLRSWFSNIQQGDVNLDGVVNGLDIATIASHWLQSGTGLLGGDVNGDGVVNGLDIAGVAGHWLATGGAPGGGGSGSAASVPEPSTGVLCALAMFSVLALRRSQKRQRLVA